MAIVVETGTGASNSESYISVADADTRHAAVGNATWASLTTGEKEIALRKATRYLVATYRTRWKGERINSTQALDWPRYGVQIGPYYLDSNAVPVTVADACADLALKASTEELAPDLERAVVEEQVGPLRTRYSEFSPQQKRFKAISDALAPFLTGGAGMVRVCRA